MRVRIKARREQGGKPTPYMGVRYNTDTGLYLAFVRTGKDSTHHYTDLGWYDTAIEAARAHDEEKLKRLGPTARLNFPVELPKERSKPPVPCKWVRKLVVGQRVYAVRRVRVTDADGCSIWQSEYFAY
jgi:hypothetical protein